jgi:type IV pilus assembly protein PilC
MLRRSPTSTGTKLRGTANLLALLEPLIIAFLGLVIGGIVVSMYLPMFALISKIA